MKTRIINFFFRILYRYFLKPVLFRMDPEKVHDHVTKFGVLLGKTVWSRRMVERLFFFEHPMLEQQIVGIFFKNPFGLAAGFDKNAQLVHILSSIGFGFIEVGSITGEPCLGNPRPRLWRMPQSQGLAVYYGLKNDGAEVVARRLSQYETHVPLGVSLAKTNDQKRVDVQEGVADYLKAYTLCAGKGDYVTVNISCPNTFGGEPFTDPTRLHQLLNQIDARFLGNPIFLKLSPDMNKVEIDGILQVVTSHHVHGFICSNLTKQREQNPKILDSYVPKQGGFSGKIVEEASNQQIQMVYKKTKGRYVIIGCGGVFSAQDAYKKIRLGASLVQLMTGMIFRGPQLISELKIDLVRLLENDGFHDISEAIGIDVQCD